MTGLLIGEFARRSRLPVSTLRYYDEIGLLTPDVVDPATGYRRYAVEQLPAAALIARLRAIGVAPPKIAVVLAGGAAAAEALHAERRRLRAALARNQRALDGLDELLDTRTYPVEKVEKVEKVDVPECRVAARAFAVAFDQLRPGVMRTIAELRAGLRRAGQPWRGPWGATFPLDLGDRVEGYVFVRAPDGGTVTLPAGRALTTLHHGSVDTVADAYRALFAQAGEPVGPVVEEYLDDAVRVTVGSA